MNEFELIARFFTRPPRAASVVRGVGDDAALLAPTPGMQLVAAVDMLVAGRHFFADVDAESLGHKSLAVNLSDIAAMGAVPRWVLLAGALPDSDPAWVGAFARGFHALADVHGVDLVGGDTTRGPLNLCVTILGEVSAGHGITRAGARAGDDVYVSGALGDAALALAAMTGRTMVEAPALASARRRLEWPVPRVALGQALAGVATAMLDVSDGLTGDLCHILDASKAGATIELAAIPCSPALAAKLAGEERVLGLQCLLAGGDDYELCFTAPRATRARIAGVAADTRVPLARIGEITAGGGLEVRDADGVAVALPRAFDHFAGG